MSFFKSIAKEIGRAGSNLEDAVRDVGRGAESLVRDTASNLESLVKDTASNIGDFVEPVFSAASDALTFLFTGGASAFGRGGGANSTGIPEIESPKDQGFQIQRNFDSNASLPIIYGDEVKVKGVVIVKEVSSDYKFLHVFYAMSVEQGSVRTIFIDGQSGVDAEWVFDNTTNTYNPNTRFITKARFAVSRVAGGLGNLPNDYGCTIYNKNIDLFDKMNVIYARYTYDRDVYQGEPQIYALMRHSMPTYSNPANALKDYLTVSDYGAKIPSAKIDDASFTAAAALCDELVAIPATGGTRKRYTINTLLDTKSTISENINTIISLMDGDLIFTSGKYSLKLKGQGDAVVTFDDNVIIGDVSFSTQDDAEQFNVVVVNFTDKNLNYKTNAAIYKSSDIAYPFAGYPSDFKAIRDDGVEKEKRITLNGVSSFYEAQAFAEKMLKRSLFSRVCQVTTSWQTAEANVGDIVGLTVEEFGFANKEFRVLEKQVGLEGTITWKLMEHEDSVYSITYDNAEPSAGTITYPNPWERLAAPVGLSITEIDDGKAQLNFTQLTSDLVDTYVVEVVNQLNVNQVFRFFGTGSPIYFEVDTVGTFGVSVYAVSDLQINGIKSSPLSWSSLGFKAEWTQVVGDDKPEDNATNSKTYYQDTPPANPRINDIWVDTSVTPNVTKVRGEFNLNWVVAATLNTGALADKNAVDLSTSEVLNKTADNIIESSTKKWAGESGADKTITAINNDLVITSGGVTIDSGGAFKSQGVNLATNSGIYFGYNPSSSEYEFMVGDGSEFIRWNGQSLYYPGRSFFRSGYTDVSVASFEISESFTQFATFALDGSQASPAFNSDFLIDAALNFSFPSALVGADVEMYLEVTINGIDYTGSTPKQKVAFSDTGILINAVLMATQSASINQLFDVKVYGRYTKTGTTGFYNIDFNYSSLKGFITLK